MSEFKREVDAHEQLDYYHGLIDKNDLEILLVEEGDFLLRIEEINNKRRIITSCMHDKNKSGQEKIRHLEVKKNRKNKWTIDGSGAAHSIAALIKHYVKSKKPIQIVVPNPRKPLVLIRPIQRASWELDANAISNCKKIGQGEFGDVLTGTLLLKTRKKIDVAIKIAKPGTKPNKKVIEFFTEARLMRSFDHPNVVKLYGVVYEPIMLVMELVPEGSLHQYLKKNRGTVSDEEKLDHMVMGTAWGLEYLHSKNCIHMDIACRNCLYSKDAVKICDFGLTRQGVIYTLKQSCNLPVKWLSPETLELGQFTPKSDVFSFGIMIWEIFADGTEPYLGMTNEQVQKAVVGGLRLEFEHASEDLVNFVTNRMWEANPKDRLTMSEICRSLETMLSKDPTIPAANRKIMKDSQRKEDSRKSQREKIESTQMEQTDVTEDSDERTMMLSAIKKTDDTPQIANIDATQLEKTDVTELEKEDVTELEKADGTQLEKTDVTQMEKTDPTESETGPVGMAK